MMEYAGKQGPKKGLVIKKLVMGWENNSAHGETDLCWLGIAANCLKALTRQ